MDSLECTSPHWGYCHEPYCPKHGHHAEGNETIVSVIPPTMDEHRRRLYENHDTDDDEGGVPIRLEQVEDDRDAADATALIKTTFRAQLIAAYRQDHLYKLAMNSNPSNKDLQHYHISDGLLYATTRKGEHCLYIPKGHAINGSTLRETVIEEIHSKGHHSAERNLRYATEYLYWPEIRTDFRDYVRQCQSCQENKERTTRPQGRMQMLQLETEIFNSYAIDFAGPFNKSLSKDSILVVVDRCVGYTWLIPTESTVTAEGTLSLLRDMVFAPHGMPTSIITDSDPRFTSHFWQQSMMSLGIEHIKAVPGHHETNGQVERKIRELKTALRNLVNKRQTNWAQALPETAAYLNAGHSDTLGMSPYKAVYGIEYPLLTTVRFTNSTVPATEDYLNRHQELRNTAYQAVKQARMRSTRTAAKRRRHHTPLKVGDYLLVLVGQTSTTTGRSRKLLHDGEDLSRC